MSLAMLHSKEKRCTTLSVRAVQRWWIGKPGTVRPILQLSTMSLCPRLLIFAFDGVVTVVPYSEYQANSGVRHQAEAWNTCSRLCANVPTSRAPSTITACTILFRSG